MAGALLHHRTWQSVSAPSAFNINRLEFGSTNITIKNGKWKICLQVSLGAWSVPVTGNVFKTFGIKRKFGNQSIRDSKSNSSLNDELQLQSSSNGTELVANGESEKTSVPDLSTEVRGEMECIGTGSDVECVLPSSESDFKFGGKVAARAVDIPSTIKSDGKNDGPESLVQSAIEFLVLISPFFFWGTAMVAMKGVLAKGSPFFVASTRLIPAGALLVAFASFTGRKQPSSIKAWASIFLFGLVDAACFQGFLAEGLKRTSAGLGSVIIDSQPLTVAILAAILFGEEIGTYGVVGLVTGVLGLILLELPPNVLSVVSLEDVDKLVHSVDWNKVWDSGEWWMLLAAQSMAIGTIMVRWVCRYSDSIMATGWHMVLGGLPLLVISGMQHDLGNLYKLDITDWLALTYVSIFGSAISYGVFFYNATKGSLTRLSSLTFFTPMFAALFGYLFLEETLSPLQLFGAITTLGSIYLINAKGLPIKAKDGGSMND